MNQEGQLEQLFRAFREVKKPTTIEGCGREECSFCPTTEQMHMLLNSDQRSLSADDLQLYVSNVFITVGTPEDFVYFLPALLKAWSEELDDQECSFRASLHPALRKARIRCANLSPALWDAISAFMRPALLERLGREQSLHIQGKSMTHDWFGIVAAYGTFVVDLPTLWEQWWEMPSTGHAIATIQWASCLICDDKKKENSVFDRWSPEHGGGGGLWLLTGYDSMVPWDECWLPDNLSYLERTLSVEYLKQKLIEAQQHLIDSDQKERVATLQSLLKKESARTQSRIQQVLTKLRTPEGYPVF